MIRLSPRLACIASLIPPAECLADIGCDHGRLDAHLLQSGRAARVIASDISTVSVEKARSLLTKCGLSDRCSFRVGDGLSVLKAGEADVIVLAGLGGPEILDILSAPVNAFYVLQPQNLVPQVRQSLTQRGLFIEDEAICQDRGRYYEVMRLKAGEMRLNALEAEFGPVNLTRRTPALRALQEQKLRLAEHWLNKLKDAHTPKALGDRAAWEEKRALYRALKWD